MNYIIDSENPYVDVFGPLSTQLGGNNVLIEENAFEVEGGLLKLTFLIVLWKGNTWPEFKDRLLLATWVYTQAGKKYIKIFIVVSI